MKVSKTNIEGLLLIEPDLFSDDRGYFFESYRKEKYAEIGLDINFVQDNISQSKKGTLRGLHYQVGDKAQGKLCQVISGKILDV
ncbi:MAG: dTDP-4-dehydrorhamnose 3,5-epimerase family protein, partial [Ignavibacteriaceae bacterium]